MTIQFPARPSGSHYDDGRVRRAMITRRSLFKLGAGSAAIAAAGAYGLDRGVGNGSIRRINDLQTQRPIKNLTLVGTDGWVSMPSGAAPTGTPGTTIWPDAFAPGQGGEQEGQNSARNLYIFGFAPGGRFDTPNRLQWGDVWNGVPGTPAEAIGGLVALKNRANFSAPVLYYHEGDDVRITLWNGGMGNRPDIVDAHTIHWHGFPNQVPYFDGVPNDSLAVPIGANLVYRYLPYRGMAGTYMYHCHVSDAEHVQMGLQGVVFIRPYQNYGVSPSIPQARATGATTGPLGYVFNDGVGFTYTGPGQYPWSAQAGYSTAYDREFAYILDEVDPRVHWDDAHFQEQDFTAYTPRFGTMNGRAWPDTIEGNWNVLTPDPDAQRVNNYPNTIHFHNKHFLYNIATVDQVLADPSADPWNWSLHPRALTTSNMRLGSQPWSSLIQANAGETIVLRFSNLGYAEHSMELAGLPFIVIGEDAKNLLAGRDG